MNARKQNLVSGLLKATTKAGVDSIIDQLGSLIGNPDILNDPNHWKPVGGFPNNSQIIGIGTDAVSGLIERITNSFDAVLEYQDAVKGGAISKNCATPKEAAKLMCGGDISKMKDGERKKIAENVEVTLSKSGNKKKPTIGVRDYGIGLSANDFGSTILSLVRENKWSKPYLHGCYGMGGSTCLSYCVYTVIVSSKHDSDKLGFTVVRYSEKSDMKSGTYEYLVDASTGNPYELTIADGFFKHGTFIQHIEIDIPGYRESYGLRIQNQSGFHYHFNHNMFNSTLPFLVRDERNPADVEEKVMKGFHSLLNRDRFKILSYKNEATLKFGNGKVTCSYWVFKNNDKQGQVEQRAPKGHPIIITHNGQKQGGKQAELTNRIISKDCGFAFLDGAMIVEVDCTYLDKSDKKDLFSTNRENIRNTSTAVSLRNLLVDVLKSDECLIALNEEYKNAVIKQGDSTLDDIAKRLQKKFSFSMGNSKYGSNSSENGQSPKKEHVTTPKPVIPEKDPPELFETTIEHRHVRPGKNFSIPFCTDANSRYFDKSNIEFEVLVDSGTKLSNKDVEYLGHSKVVDGYGTMYFHLSSGARVGDNCIFVCKIKVEDDDYLETAIELVVVKDDSKKTQNPGKKREMTIKIIEINERDKYWSENNWDDTSVIDIKADNGDLMCFVSTGNANLVSLLERKACLNGGEATISKIREKYIEPIVYHGIQCFNENDGLDDSYKKELERVSSTTHRNIEENFTAMLKS